MKSRAQQLLDELLSLYIKYGRDDFINVGRELRQGNLVVSIATAVEALAAAAPRARPIGAARKYGNQVGSIKLSSKETLLQYISILESSGDEKKVSIAVLLKKIMARDVLPSPSALRYYLESAGIPIGQKLDRYRSAKKIADILMELPIEETKSRIQHIEQTKSTRSSLQEWTDIIVKSDRREGK